MVSLQRVLVSTALIASMAASVAPVRAEQGLPLTAAGTFECLVEPMVVADVGSPVQGVIEELKADRSEFVKRGQPIALLKSDVERATLEQARARAGMESEMRARAADLELADHSMTRMNESARAAHGPAQQRDEALAQLQVARAALNEARENYRLLQHELSRAEQVLAQRTIRSSPITGVVVMHKAFPGEFVYEKPDHDHRAARSVAGRAGAAGTPVRSPAAGRCRHDLS